MKLSEVFSQLAYGELSQLGLAGDNFGEINPDKYLQILSHTNLGLTALYKRFALKQGRVGFTLETGKVIYVLNNNSNTLFLDIDGEFADDILKIESVHTMEGVELPLNNASEPYNCVTPSSNVLRLHSEFVNKDVSLFPELLTDAVVVGYRANHPIIKVSGAFDPTLIDIELPYTHLEPLLFFIASRVHNPIGMSNEFHAGNSYAAKYEKACELLEKNNLQIDVDDQNTRLGRGGWV